MSDTKRIASNAIWLMIIEVLIRVIGLITVMFKARYLGPDDFGILGFVLTTANLFLIIPDLGIFNVLVRELSKDSSDKGSLLFQSLLIRFFMSVFAWLAIMGYLTLGNYDNQVIYFGQIMGITVFTQSWMLIFIASFQCRLEMKFVAISNMVIAVINLVLTLIIISLKADLEKFVYLNLIYSGSLCFSIGIISKIRYKWAFQVNWHPFKKLLKDSWPLWFSAAFVMIYNKIDVLMLSKLADYKSIGLYHSAIKFLEPTLSMGNAVVLSLMPIYIKNMEKGNREQGFFLDSSFRVLLILGWFIGVGASTLGPIILKYCFGLQYIEAAPVLKILVWSGVFSFFAMLLSALLIYINKQIIAVFFGVILVIFNVVLNYYWIPLWQELGAAWSTFLTELLHLLFLACFLFKKIKDLPLKLVFKGIMIIIFSAVIFYYCNNFKTVLAILISSIVMYKFKFVNKNDFVKFKDIMLKKNKELI